MLLALALVASLQKPFDFYAFGPYDSKIARPDAVLGYGPGERHTTYHDQERVMAAVGQSGRVKRIDFGKSTEGRGLRILAITSPENHKRLEDILRRNQDLADAKPGVDTKDLPVIVWFNQCIHGNETASFESAMWLTYTLAASNSRAVTDLLDRAVVVVNPSYNPDGHERFVVWYNSVSRGDASDDAFEHMEQGVLNGRGNHYRFDLNRDRVAMSQVETQQEVAEFRKWNPHVYVDQHGQVGTYFFPPVAQSIHKDIDRERYIALSTVLGEETAKAFDEQGWRYYIRETFDFYGAIYLDTWASFNGAVGMTHETDGGRAVRREREDGSVVTLRDGMAKHFTSALAVLRASVRERERFIEGFAKYKQDASTAAHTPVKGVVVSGDSRALDRFRSLLDHQGIAYGLSTSAFTLRAASFFEDAESAREFSGNQVVVDFAQPRGHLASAILAPGQDFEQEFIDRQMRIRAERKLEDQNPSRDFFEFYDMTGWSVPMAFGLDAYWTTSRPVGKAPSLVALRSRNVGGKVGWEIPYTDQEDALAVIELLQAGIRVHVATKEMNVGRKIVPGTFFVFRDRNDADIDLKVTQVLNSHKCQSVPLETSFPASGVVGPGSDSVSSIAKPEIAVVFGDQPSTSQFGSTWYVFEKVFKLPFTAISQRALSGDLSKYTAIVLPPGARVTSQLKEWVQGGGVAIGLGNGGLVGSEWIDLKESKLKEDKNPTELPGTIFMASLNPRSPLAFGYDTSKPIGVMVSGSSFYKKREEGGGAVLIGDSVRVLSGWSWPDELDALKDTVWVHDEPVGGGHAVWFAEDPTMRAMFPVTYRMLLNAVLLGR